MTARPMVLVVDDEPQMRQLVRYALAAQEIDCEFAWDAASAWALLQERPFSVLVLDVMMPGESGISLCRRLREVSDIAIVLLTALGSEDERVAGLEAGADDYVVKPFSPRELALRVAALARRASTPVPLARGAVRTVGELRLEAGAQQVHIGERPVRLTPSEFRMLWMMAGRVGETVTWRELHEAMAVVDARVGERELVRTAVYRLRAKLGDDPANPRFVLTDRGRGYRLIADVGTITEV